jgi:hypothetical protein
MLVKKCIQEECKCFSHELTGNPKIDPDCQFIDWCNKFRSQIPYPNCPIDGKPVYYKADKINQYKPFKLPDCCPDCKICPWLGKETKIKREKVI